MAKLHLPQPISLVVCDDVIRDADSGKVHLIGSASGLASRSFPHVLDTMTLYIALMAGPGTHSGQVVGLAPDESTIFGSTPHVMKFTASAPLAQAVFRLRHVPFPTTGIYRLRFLCDNQFVTERPLLVRFKGSNGDV